MDRRWLVVVIGVVLACGDERARVEREARTRAEQAQREAATRTADAARVAREAQAYAEDKAAAAAARVDIHAAARAVALGQRAKAELDKVYELLPTDAFPHTTVVKPNPIEIVSEPQFDLGLRCLLDSLRSLAS